MGDETSPVRNEVRGSAHIVVQAGSVYGGVHVHPPALRIPHQLPGRIEELINQHRVLDGLAAGLTDRPPLDDPVVKVVVGPRGSGKSTVAAFWLNGCQDRYPDGQLYATLGAWTDYQAAPREVLGEFLVALGVARGDVPPDLNARSTMFRSFTHGLSLQVFLDDALTPAQVRALLPGRGGSVVVVTGHGAFGTLRQLGAAIIDVEPLEPDMAVELLRQFAGDRVHEDPGAREAVVALCAGLPVALCLVGALLAEQPDLSFAELLEELTDPHGGLTRLAVDGVPTLSALFDVSYQRLSVEAQACYRALGTHLGGADFSVDVLAAALDMPGLRLRAPVRELVTMRLVEEPSRGRLVVHNLIREHARHVSAVIDQPVERDSAQERIITWYLAGAVAADSILMSQRPWRARLFPELPVDSSHPAAVDARVWMRTERTNLRAVVFSAYQRGDHDTVVRLCIVLWSLYEPDKFYDDLLTTHALGVRAAEHLRVDLVRSVLLVQIGFAHLHRGEPGAALASFDGAAEAGRAMGDVEAEATAVEGAGLAELDLGNDARARALLRRNLELAELIGDPRRLALARFHLAKAEPPDTAIPLLDRALDGFHTLAQPEPRNLAKIMLWLGRRLAETAATARARQQLGQALAITTEQDWPFDRAQVLEALGDLETGSAARAYYEQALAIYDEHGFVHAGTRTRQHLQRAT